MKKLFFWVLLFPIALMAQTSNLYTIQVGTFISPQVEDFQIIQPIGYLYAEPFGDNFSKVFLGEYKTLPTAEKALNQVRGKGYKSFIAERPIGESDPLIIVQFATQQTGTPIDWTPYEPIGKLYTLIEDAQRVKVVTGPFNDMTIARKRALEIQKLGYKDAFVKKINPQLLHEVSNFELGKEQVVKDLKSVVDAILNDEIVESYGEETPIITPAKNVSVTPSLPLPSIKAKVKRTAALDIQRVLKIQNYYTGSLDGFYGKGTASAYTKFEQTDFQYKNYELLADYHQQNTDVQPTGFQELINNLPNNARVILGDLKKTKTPLAKAYQAYWLLANNGDVATINQLMNAAIQETFVNKKLRNSPPFDFSATYSYEKMEQLILHLRYLHAAPNNSAFAIPCWLFERHPDATFAAFKTKSKFASFANTKIANCKSFDDWKSLKIMNAIIADLQPTSFSKEQLSRKATLEAGRSFLYLFPEKLDKKQKKETEEWLNYFWKSLEDSGKVNPVLAKRLPTLKTLFFQSQVLLEDFYMTKNFSSDEAEGLALSVLKTYVDVPLGVYVK